MYVDRLLTRLHGTELGLADEFRRVGERHAPEADVPHICELLARQSVALANALLPHLERYAGRRPHGEAEDPGAMDGMLSFVRRKLSEAEEGHPAAGLRLIHDLTDLSIVVYECSLLWTQAGQVAQALRDAGLLDTVGHGDEQSATALRWLKTRIKELAPQTLTVSAP